MANNNPTIPPETRKTMNNMNDILSKLKEKLSCDSACQKKRTADELKQKWLNAERQAKNSGEEIESAKKNYYLYAEGKNGYNNLKKSEYIHSTADYEKNASANHKKLVNEINNLLERYEFNLEHKESLFELSDIKIKENKELENKIDDYGKTIFTNERKVIYENHDMARIMTYNKILIFIYYGLFILFLIIGNFFSDKLYTSPKIWAVLIFYVIFPFTLAWIVRHLFAIKNKISYLFNNKVYKNVYTNI